MLRTSTDPFPCVVFELSDDEESRTLFPSPFKLQYSVSLDGPDSVSTALSVLNTGAEPLKFTTALHTYFAVSDVGSVELHGLGGVKYEDNANGNAEGARSIARRTGLACPRWESSRPPRALASAHARRLPLAGVQPEGSLTFAGEFDRVYLGAPAEAYIVDGARALKVAKRGFPDAVVWNIGGEKAGNINDMGPGEWQRYVCYEAALIGKPAEVAPGASWIAGQTFTCLDAKDVPAACAAAK